MFTEWIILLFCTIDTLAVLRYYRPWTRPDDKIAPLKFERKRFFLSGKRINVLLTPNDPRHAVNHSANKAVWVIHSRVKRFKSVSQSSTAKFAENAPKFRNFENTSFCYYRNSILYKEYKVGPFPDE